MADIPVIFSAPMVQALLREVREPGTGKTMTRRLATTERKIRGPGSLGGDSDQIERPSVWQKVKVGDRLYVRENFSGPYCWSEMPPRDWAIGGDIWYWADGNPGHGDWTRPRPSIHIPRWATRLTLIVTATKIERLQDITEADAEAEGADLAVAGHDVVGRIRTHRTGFVRLWTSLHGADSWQNNPWVVAVSFRVIRANIDKLEAKAA